MKEITEEEAYELAKGANEFPVLFKEEDAQTESAVTLKQFPTGYVLVSVVILKTYSNYSSLKIWTKLRSILMHFLQS